MKLSNLKTKDPLQLAIVLAMLIVCTGSVYALYQRDKLHLGNDEFDVEAVLPPSISQPPANRVFNQQDLAAGDGKEGRNCYVAINGTVYEILQGRLWTNGEHATSNGKAYCGADLTQALKESPHGDSKLKDTTVVGTLE